jgi:hypothetical protein
LSDKKPRMTQPHGGIFLRMANMGDVFQAGKKSG